LKAFLDDIFYLNWLNIGLESYDDFESQNAKLLQ